MMDGRGRNGDEAKGRVDGHMRHRVAWITNGAWTAGGRHPHGPIMALERGRSYVLDGLDDTSWRYAMHLHGHVFRVPSRDGRRAPPRERLDPVPMTPGERVGISFPADIPKDRTSHRHVLERQQAGLVGAVRDDVGGVPGGPYGDRAPDRCMAAPRRAGGSGRAALEAVFRR